MQRDAMAKSYQSRFAGEPASQIPKIQGLLPHCVSRHTNKQETRLFPRPFPSPALPSPASPVASGSGSVPPSHFFSSGRAMALRAARHGHARKVGVEEPGHAAPCTVPPLHQVLSERYQSDHRAQHCPAHHRRNTPITLQKLIENSGLP